MTGRGMYGGCIVVIVLMLFVVVVGVVFSAVPR